MKELISEVKNQNEEIKLLKQHIKSLDTRWYFILIFGILFFNKYTLLETIW